MKIRNRLAILAGFACATGLAASKVQEVYAYKNDDPVTLAGSKAGLHATLERDTTLRTGTLDNGLTYYVKSHSEPEKKAKLMLIIKAGSLQEDDDQLGYAHFIEHMAFNGTRNFPKRAIIEYLESIGLKFGADVNAFTSFDRTVFEITLPTVNPENVTNGLRILADWAGAVNFDSADVVSERGVIVEEWRGRQGKRADLAARHDSALNIGSRYLSRQPIGTYESIISAEPAPLKRFYRDWYRPNLMAVVLVGDVDAVSAEGNVKSMFSGLTNPVSERPIEQYKIPLVESPVVSIIKDSLILHPSVTLATRFNESVGSDMELARQGIVFSIFSNAINGRLAKLTKVVDAPFRRATVSGAAALDGSVIVSIRVVGRGQSPLNSFEAVVSEIDRIARFGLNDVEFERIKTLMVRSMEQTKKSPAKPSSFSYASAYSNLFTDGTKIENMESALALRSELLPTITQDEIKQVAALWKVKENRFFLLEVPDNDLSSVPETESLLSVLDGIPYLPLTEYKEETVVAETFLPELPTPGKIVSKIEHPDSVQEWKLSNGIRVLLRQTPDGSKATSLFGRSKGGFYRNVDSLGLMPSMSIDQTVGVGGAGKFTAEQLGKMIETRDILAVQWNVGPYEEHVTVVAKNEDVETALQLIHLFLKEPRIDTVLLEKKKSDARDAAAHRVRTAEMDYRETVQLAMTQSHPLIVQQMTATLDSIDPAKSLLAFKDRFSDMSDFRFIIVGDFNYDVMDSIVQTYIASLPGGGRVEEYSDVRILPPEGHVRKRVYGANSASAQATLVFTGQLEPTREAGWEISLLTEIITTRLIQVLREDLGGVYSPNARVDISRVPDSRYHIEIGFASDPNRIDELVAATLGVLRELQDSLVPDMYVSSIKSGALNNFDRTLRDPDSWANRIETFDNLGVPFTRFRDNQGLQDVTPEKIREAARKFLDLKNYKLFEFFPGVAPE